MVRSRIRITAVAAVGAALALALLVMGQAPLTSADTGWPTPPPGPQAQVPRIVDEADVKQVDVPLVPGATSWIVNPIAMLVPRFPPVPSARLQAPDGVLIASDAGSVHTTVQLVYEPIGRTNAPDPGPRQDLRQVFSVRTFDHRGGSIDLELLRPWVLEVPAQGLTSSFEDLARLLLARYDKDKGWQPLVTTYHRDREILQAHVLEMWIFAVVAEPAV